MNGFLNGPFEPETGKVYSKAAIRPALSFILPSAIFSVISLPILGLLFALSTPRSRLKPIFILNILAVCLGIASGMLSIHITVTQMLMSNPSPSLKENIIYINLAMWTPLFTEAILILRVIAIFKPTLYSRFSNMSALLALPVILKIARATTFIVWLVEWSHENSFNLSNGKSLGPYPGEFWVLQATVILETVDNGSGLNDGNSGGIQRY
ncbi:hypothetical protein H0H81_002591 [Sphagnurus paluster]|uniref:Uncharacterized protein n=1 Tax=Sphagnurus paluster TaxID=117069 RepID=A0A9P7K4I0_9AGAR|nr:hypothetical protein H0H81_002591 [Sphagnurus paluster]